MTERRLRKAMGLLVLIVALLLAVSAPAFGDPSVCEAGDPPVGVNLISWWNFGAQGESVWEEAVQRAHDFGFRAVSLSPLRFVDPATGAIALSDGSTSGPDLAHIAAGVARARQLGMTVTLNPFVEPDGFASWRGQMNFSGSAKSTFFADYRAYLVEVADMGRDQRAQRMNVGTELKALVNDPAHVTDWQALISTVATHFQGQLGYAANWDNYTSANLTTAIWEHPDIDCLGVDAYFPLATVAEADGPGPPPDGPGVSSVEARWNDVLDAPASGFNHGILSFAAARKGGAGMPVVLTEHGLIPYNRTTTAPWSTGPSSQPTDPDEQADGYRALLRALDQRYVGGLLEVHVWHWGMPGAAGSLWYLDPEGDAVVEGATAAQVLSDHESQCPSPCMDGLDNDVDGLIDYPDDPGCGDALDMIEDPQCQDGVNNDPGQDPTGLSDFDGGQSIWGECTGELGGCPANVSDPEGDGVANPDPQCVGKPWKNAERTPWSPCGLGAGLALLLPPLMWLYRMRSRRL